MELRHSSTNTSGKIALIGDGLCGKTSLLLAYLNDDKKFHSRPEPTVLDTCLVKVDLKQNNTLAFICWDTAGQEDYEKLRPLTYKNLDLVIVFYSIDKPDSLDNVIEKWFPDLRYFCPGAPIILVGNKKDIRDANYAASKKIPKKRLLTKEEGEQMSKRIRAQHFFECSSRTGENVEEIFEMAAMLLLINSKIKDHQKSLKRKLLSSKGTCQIL